MILEVTPLITPSVAYENNRILFTFQRFIHNKPVDILLEDLKNGFYLRTLRGLDGDICTWTGDPYSQLMRAGRRLVIQCTLGVLSVVGKELVL